MNSRIHRNRLGILALDLIPVRRPLSPDGKLLPTGTLNPDGTLQETHVVGWAIKVYTDEGKRFYAPHPIRPSSPQKEAITRFQDHFNRQENLPLSAYIDTTGWIPADAIATSAGTWDGVTFEDGSSPYFASLRKIPSVAFNTRPYGRRVAPAVDTEPTSDSIDKPDTEPTLTEEELESLTGKTT